MNCPRCNVALSVTQRQGVEIDVCPDCRGVWLDRGELDKIIARADSFDRDANDHRRPYRDDDRRYHGQATYPKKKSFWQELFD
ncbi:MAG: zf-TFIIB domain-containing protein [Tepidisphaeraceae bacterium]